MYNINFWITQAVMKLDDIKLKENMDLRTVDYSHSNLEKTVYLNINRCINRRNGQTTRFNESFYNTFYNDYFFFEQISKTKEFKIKYYNPELQLVKDILLIKDIIKCRSDMYSICTNDKSFFCIGYHFIIKENNSHIIYWMNNGELVQKTLNDNDDKVLIDTFECDIPCVDHRAISDNYFIYALIENKLHIYNSHTLKLLQTIDVHDLEILACHKGQLLCFHDGVLTVRF